MSDNPTGASFRFRKHEHLRRSEDFQRVYARRRSASDHWLIVYGCENGLPYLRLGLSVSRKVGQATHRNRLRRLYREAFRLTRHEMPVGIDLVLIPRRGDEPTLEQLMQSLPRLVGQVAKKLEPAAPIAVPVPPAPEEGPARSAAPGCCCASSLPRS
jgi:ribonuclease P protein component